MKVLELILKIAREVSSMVCETGSSSTAKCPSVRYVTSVAVDNSQSSPFYSFNLVNLCFGQQVVPNWNRIFYYWANHCSIEMEQERGTPARLSCFRK